MSRESNPPIEPDYSGTYQIRIKGQLGPQWSDWFEGLTVAPQDNGDTLISGRVIDQAALHGLLNKVRDLGLPLVSVKSLENDRQGMPDIKE